MDQTLRNEMLSVTPERIIAAFRAEELSERFEGYLRRPDLQALLLEGFREVLSNLTGMEGVAETTFLEVMADVPAFAYDKAKAAMAPADESHVLEVLLAFKAEPETMALYQRLSAYESMEQRIQEAYDALFVIGGWQAVTADSMDCEVIRSLYPSRSDYEEALLRDHAMRRDVFTKMASWLNDSDLERMVTQVTESEMHWEFNDRLRSLEADRIYRETA